MAGPTVMAPKKVWTIPELLSAAGAKNKGTAPMFLNIVLASIGSQGLLFALRQAAKFGAATDWTKVKADWDPRIAALIPGTKYDKQAIRVANALIDAVALVSRHAPEFESIVKALHAGDFDGAVDQTIGVIEKEVPLTAEVWNFLKLIKLSTVGGQLSAAGQVA